MASSYAVNNVAKIMQTMTESKSNKETFKQFIKSGFIANNGQEILLQAIDSHFTKQNEKNALNSKPTVKATRLNRILVSKIDTARHQQHFPDDSICNAAFVEQEILQRMQAMKQNTVDIELLFVCMDMYMSKAKWDKIQQWETPFTNNEIIDSSVLDTHAHSRCILFMISKLAPRCFLSFVFDANQMGMGGRQGIGLRNIFSNDLIKPLCDKSNTVFPNDNVNQYINVSNQYGDEATFSTCLPLIFVWMIKMQMCVSTNAAEFIQRWQNLVILGGKEIVSNHLYSILQSSCLFLLHSYWHQSISYMIEDPINPMEISTVDPIYIPQKQARTKQTARNAHRRHTRKVLATKAARKTRARGNASTGTSNEFPRKILASTACRLKITKILSATRSEQSKHR